MVGGTCKFFDYFCAGVAWVLVIANLYMVGIEVA